MDDLYFTPKAKQVEQEVEIFDSANKHDSDNDCDKNEENILVSYEPHPNDRYLDIEGEVDYEDEDDGHKPLFCTPEPIDDELLEGGCIGDDGFLYEKSLIFPPNDSQCADALVDMLKCNEQAPYGLPLAYHRVNSSQILYQKKERKVKFVDQYLLGDTLGEGSYSKVKEVLDTVSLERKAAKIMKKKRLRKIPNGEQNVQREISILRKLNHENVIKLYDVIYDPIKEKMYIIMEYAVSVLQELLDSVPSKKLPVHQAHSYFVQLISGLEYLHSQGIIHKDIKPGNLLIANGGIIKISDLGVSEMLDQFKQSDMISLSQGSPAFQPPEIADGQAEFSGFKVDIWACGVTLYNIVTGKYPFQGDNVYRLFDNIILCKIVIPSDVETLLADLISGMLRKDPVERFSIQSIKSHDWVKKKHPIIEPTVKIPKKNNNEYRSMSVLPYLYELHNDVPGGNPAFALNAFDDEDFEQFSGQLGGYSSSGGSISRMNELTVHSMVSNASKNSKSSRTSTKSTLSFFKLKKSKSARSNFALEPLTKANKLMSCFGLSRKFP